MTLAAKEPVYIIIPVHNRKDITLKCLEHLDKSGDLQKYHVVVVNDGSTDGTTKAIHSLYPNVTVLLGDGNLWWTGAIKKGMEYAYEQGAEYFIWLNDDCLVSDRAIRDLVNFSFNNKNSIIGCQVYELNSPETISFGGSFKNWKGYQFINFPENEINKCDVLSGNLVCIPVAVIEIIGYPDANTFPHYGGDIIFFIRARKAGCKIFIDSRNKVFNIDNQVKKVAPNRWMLNDGNPLSVIKLIFTPQSILNWKIILVQDWEDYALLGVLLYFYKYVWKILIPIIFITLLRFLPLSIRYKLSNLKNKYV
ncbi:MAG: glycosyltransferase family 2 protein [Xenococcaceae cyanobacterium MO_188.B32]|nr:glycosyltransferase family 2 protein [Xenococcaceae cyanobacterium MO_188.B32]